MAHALTLTIVHTGCGVEREASEFTVADSAGIRVTFQPLDAVPPARRIASEPLLRLGTVEGPSTKAFVRISDGFVRDGDVVVVDAGANSWMAFGPDGEARVQAGEEGSGPGEFLRLSRVRPFRGDSLLAWDVAYQRISVWDRNGRFGRSFELERSPVQGGLLFLVGVVADSMAVVQREGRWRGGGSGEVVPAEVRLEILDPRGARVREIGPLEGRDQTRLAGDDATGGRLVHLGAQPVARTVGETVVWAAARAPELHWFTPDGRLERITRWRDRRASVTSGVIREMDRARGYEGQVYADVAPAYDFVIATDSRVVWVREFSLEEGGERRWLAVRPDGRIADAVTIPGSYQVLDFTEEAVLLVTRDELDVQYVELRAF